MGKVETLSVSSAVNFFSLPTPFIETLLILLIHKLLYPNDHAHICCCTLLNQLVKVPVTSNFFQQKFLLIVGPSSPFPSPSTSNSYQPSQSSSPEMALWFLDATSWTMMGHQEGYHDSWYISRLTGSKLLTKGDMKSTFNNLSHFFPCQIRKETSFLFLSTHCNFVQHHLGNHNHINSVREKIWFYQLVFNI